MIEPLARWCARVAEVVRRWCDRPAQTLARGRVTLGFVFGAFVLGLAQPTWTSLVWGSAVALVGEAIRVWSAGHLEKSREVTQSGPYAWTRHPLYLGSSIIAAGLAVAANSVIVAAMIALYVGTFIPAAIRRGGSAPPRKIRRRLRRLRESPFGAGAAPVQSLACTRQPRTSHDLGRPSRFGNPCAEDRAFDTLKSFTGG